jgi:hypothetical protein
MASSPPENIDFRCDSMRVLSRPNRTVGRRHVVIRRADLLICCDQFETTADPLWRWQRMVCRNGVRAQRGDEVVWADHAELILDRNDLVLTGRPILRRGATWLTGSRVTLNLDESQARILRPRGHLPGEEQAYLSPLVPIDLTAPLPATCPIAPRQ